MLGFVVLALLRERTFTAGGISRTAHVTAEVYDAVTIIRLLLGRDDFAQDFLDFRRVLHRFGVKAQPTVDSDAVGVRHDARDAEHDA